MTRAILLANAAGVATGFCIGAAIIKSAWYLVPAVLFALAAASWIRKTV